MNVDTVIYRMPDGYQADQLPDNIIITSNYGEYKATPLDLELPSNLFLFKKGIIIPGHQ